MRVGLNITAVVLLGLLTCRQAMSHAGADATLYVAPDGVDAGLCQDATAPCQSLGYALAKLGKGGQIRVASGRYQIADSDELFHLVNGSIDISGGYNAGLEFRVAAAAPTTLTGVPVQYAEAMLARGFEVVADNKAADREAFRAMKDQLSSHRALEASMSATPCVDGNVNGMPCQNVDLLSHVGSGDISARPGDAADVWGFVDLNTNREYALVGFDIGTAVFDVTDPTNPREVGFVDGQRTVWRDIKVYQFWNAAQSRWNAQAYITTDGSTDGLFVIDLSGLPHSIRRVDYVSDFSAAHNVYATNTDFGTGLTLTGNPPSIVIAGSNNGAGPYRAYSVGDPTAPRFEVMPGTGRADYMHDAASMIISDSRKDTQCVNAASYCELLFDFNESTVDIWDITDTGDPVRLSRTNYPNAAYVHSGWWSEDRQYVFVHDELDERDRGLNTTLRAFDLSDLRAPSFAGSWTGPTGAIDHNGFVRGNRYYMSNYSRGLTILDITNVTSMATVGRLDTFPGSDGTAFVGAWGVYPFFHSGSIAISDIDSGFYLAADRTLAVPEGRLAFSSRSYGGTEGSPLQISVSRLGGTSGDVSVAYEILAATADAGDVAGGSGVLSWSNGDADDRLITLDLLADAQPSEGLERMLIKLVSPTGGATLDTTNVASVYIAEAGDAAQVQFTDAELRIPERGFATAVAVVHRSGSASGPVSVDYAISAGDAAAGVDFQGPQSGTLSWADGDADPKWVEFTIEDDGTGEGDESFDLSLVNANGASIGTRSTLRVVLADGAGINLSPNAVAGSGQTVTSGAAVTLNGSASNDPDGDALTYQWTQTAGTTVTLSGADTASASFTAPTVSSDELLRFELRVSDGTFADVATTSVTVRRAGVEQPQGGGSGASGLPMLVGLFTALLARRRRPRTSEAGTSVEREITGGWPAAGFPGLRCLVQRVQRQCFSIGLAPAGLQDSMAASRLPARFRATFGAGIPSSYRRYGSHGHACSRGPVALSPEQRLRSIR